MPTKIVHLSKWQTTVWDDPHRFKVINVGRRSGKTVLSVLKMIEVACSDKYIVWYISPTYRQSKAIAWSILKEYMPEGARAVFNETELKCTLMNGSELHLKGADSPDSLRGTKIDFAIFDEVAFFDSWSEAWKALRPILVDSRAPAWFVSTPNGFNHFYDLFNAKNSDSDFVSFHFTSYDNPYVASEEIDKARETMDDASFRQEFLADFTRPSGVVYDDWPIENFQPIEYDQNLPLHVSFDWGVNDPTAIIWIQPGHDSVRIIDYEEIADGNIEMIAQIVNAKPYKTPDLFTGDHAGVARELSTGLSPIELLAKKGIHVRSTPGLDIPGPIRLAHTYMTRLYVDSRKAERFRDCLINYRYPVVKESALNQSNEKPIHDQWSHGMRAFEYWCANYKQRRSDATPVITFSGGDPLTHYGATARRVDTTVPRGYRPKGPIRTFKK